MFGTQLSRRLRRFLAMGLVGGSCVIAPVAFGQSADVEAKIALDRVRQINEINAQKLEAEVNAACKEADRLAVSDRPAAIAKLKAALGQVESESNLANERRDRLVRTLNVKMRYLNLTANRPAAPAASGASQRRADLERRGADDDTIQRTLEAIRKHRQDGNLEESRLLADELARMFPNHPAVVAAQRTSNVASSASRSHTLRTDTARGEASAQRDMQKASTPPGSDLDFPSDWKELVKNRSRGTPMTEKEKAILKALDTPIVARLRGESFENAIKLISDQMKQPILVDRVALEEAQIKYDTPVTIETPASGLAARTLLRRLLGDYGLAYVIKEQAIEVTSNLKAKNTMSVRSYFIGDLLNNPSLAAAIGQPQLSGQLFFPQPTWANPTFNQTIVNQQASQIIDMIKESVEPDSWRIGGGTISFSAATMSLVIRQSAEVHAMLSNKVLR